MNLQKLRFAIVTHVYTTGPSFRLEEYLLHKSVRRLIFIGHPFPYAKDTRSFVRVYSNGTLVLEKKFIHWSGPELLFYVKDVFLTIWWGLVYCRNIDWFIAVDNLNFVSAYGLKLVTNVKHFIYYTIDYVPNRFTNSALNALYHFFDRCAVVYSDKVWNLSSRMVSEREKKGIPAVYRTKQIVVPIGTDVSKKPLPFARIDKYKIVHLGHLIEKQGIEMLIRSMTNVMRYVPKAHLLIIGGGPLEERLKKIVRSLHLGKVVAFTGFVEKFSRVQQLLSDAAVAVAPYVDNPRTYTRFTDPGKPKDYLASGLPVIITKVPQVAVEIEKRRCGFAIPYDTRTLSETVIRLLTNEPLLREFRKNAFEMAKTYRWEYVFDRAFKRSI